MGGFDRVVSALEMKGKVVEARGHHLPPVWWRLDNRLTALVILLSLGKHQQFPSIVIILVQLDIFPC